MKKDELKKPFKVIKKGILSAVLGVTMMAGSTGVLTGCENIPGKDGLNGATWYSGVDTPTTEVKGSVGDFYLDTDDYDIYKLTSDGWTKMGNIKGLEGPKGTVWLTGQTDPNNQTVAKTGDYYLNSTSCDVFEKTATGWNKVANLKGNSGVGAAGADGATWHSGEGAPVATLGEANDFYLDITNSRIYKKSLTGWEVVIDKLKGEDAEGKDGITWHSGTIAPVDTIGNEGDFYLNKTNWDVYKKVSNVWSWFGNIKGEPGTGTQGEAGATWLTGAGAPNASTGKDGDIYLDTNTCDIYQKDNGAWGTAVGNIKGEPGTGTQGNPGKDGATWYSGTDHTAETTAKKDDLYFNTETGDIHKKTETGWELIANIMGDDGEEGQDAPVPNIRDGEWYIGDEPTGVVAEGITPVITINEDTSNWEIDGVDTGVSALGSKGDTGATIESVSLVNKDKWGIERYFELTLNDANSTKIKTREISYLLENYYYSASTGADVLDLIKLGAQNIKLTQDVTVADAIAINKNLSIDLNNKEFKYDCVTPIVIENGLTLEFFDGDMDFSAPDTIESMIKVKTASTLILDEVKYVCDGTAVTVWGDASKLEVMDSEVIGGTYAISTNAASEDNYHVIVDLRDSKFDVTGYSIDPNSTDCLDNTAILFNVPGDLYIEGCEITGDRQAVILRGGDVVIKDSKLVNTGDHLKYNAENATKYLPEYDENGIPTSYPTWGTGNNVPMATLVVGNNSTKYQYPVNLTLTGTKIISKRAQVHTLWVDGNASENNGVKIVTEMGLFDETFAYSTMLGDNFEIALQVSNFDELEMSMYAMEFMQGIMPQFTQDILFTREVNAETYAILKQLNANEKIANGYEIVVPEYCFNTEYAEIYTAEGLKAAIEMGVRNISLCNVANENQNMGENPEMPENPEEVEPTVLTINFPLSIDYECTINLNGAVINNISTEQSVITGRVTIKNGFISAVTKSLATCAFKVTKASSLKFDGVQMISNGSGVLVEGDQARFDMVNQSAMQAVAWGVATNAEKEENYNVVINITDSMISTAAVDGTNPNYDNTAVMLNVPGTLTIENSRMMSDRQVLIVRGGTANVTNSQLGLTGRYSDITKHTNANWGTGNEVPSAVVVVGNRSASAYRYDAVLNMESTHIGALEEGTVAAPYLYIYDMDTTAEGKDVSATVYNRHEYNLATEFENKLVTNEVGAYNFEQLVTEDGGEEVITPQPTYIGVNYFADGVNAVINVESYRYSSLQDIVGAPVGGISTATINAEQDYIQNSFDLTELSLDATGYIAYKFTVKNAGFMPIQLSLSATDNEKTILKSLCQIH